MTDTQHDHPSLDGSPLLVHKDGAEGALIIGSLSGRVTQAVDERPDWAEGLVVALLAEHQGFYVSRLGTAPALASPLNYADLGWIAVDAEGNELELEADAEYRMDKIAEAVGVIRSNDLSDERQDETAGELAHVLTDGTERYTADEAKAFDVAASADLGAKTGTHNGG